MVQWFWLYVVYVPRVDMRWLCLGTDPLGLCSGSGLMLGKIKHQQSVFRGCCVSLVPAIPTPNHMERCPGCLLPETGSLRCPLANLHCRERVKCILAD